MKWKDFFYFSRVQRMGIITLLSLISLVFIALIVLPYLPVKNVIKPYTTNREVEEFRSHMISVDSLRKAGYQKHFTENFSKTEYQSMKPVYTLFNFDPNQVDSLTFAQLGIKSFIISNILKFRKKGGVFKTTESFSKVYGLKKEKFNELQPYIQIAENKISVPKESELTKQNNTQKIEDFTIELNRADTSELMKVKGIGRGYAKGIVRFRQQSGGFVSIEQLKEIYGMTDDNYSKIFPHCTVDIHLIKKINVNISGVEKLNSHPYLNFYQAKAIYELRRKKIKLKNINDLRVLTEFNEKDLLKIEPYLSFD